MRLVQLTICGPSCQNVLDSPCSCTTRVHGSSSRLRGQGQSACNCRRAEATRAEHRQQSPCGWCATVLDAELEALLFGGMTFDWMHILFVTAIVGIQCGLTSGLLHGAGWHTDRVNSFLNTFRLPARIQKGGFQDVLTKRGTVAEPVRRSASELLTLAALSPVLRGEASASTRWR